MEFRFTKFKVYGDAKELHAFTVETVNHLPDAYGYLASQMKRSALSIVLNIAEGSGKKSDKDFNRYVLNALGSIHELAASFDIARDQRIISLSIYHKSLVRMTNVKNQLGGLSKKLSVAG